MDTVRTRTAAEYRAEMEKVFSHRRHPEKPIRFEGAVLTSVVPQILSLIHILPDDVVLAVGILRMGQRPADGLSHRKMVDGIPEHTAGVDLSLIHIYSA